MDTSALAAQDRPATFQKTIKSIWISQRSILVWIAPVVVLIFLLASHFSPPDPLGAEAKGMEWPKPERLAPPSIRSMVDIWWGQQAWERGFHIFLLFVATMSSVVAAAGAKTFKTTTTQYLSISAAVSVALLNAFDLAGRADRMRDAAVLLRTAVIRYEHERDDTFNIGDLTNVYVESEALIAGSNTKLQSPAKTKTTLIKN